MANFLILRPEKQAKDLIFELKNNNEKYFIEPIFDVKNHEIKLKNQPNSVILTSFNAIFGFLSAKIDKNVKIFVLSDKISDEIVKNGYKNVEICEESNSKSLEKLILSKNFEKNHEILYFCGNFITRDFSENLSKKGLNCRNIKAYDIIYKDSFSLAFLEYVTQNKIDYVLCYSKNVVKNFSFLIKKHNLVDYFNKCKIIGFSKEIENEIKNNNFANFDNFKSVKILKEFYNF